jgi:hypothetical protein
VKKKNTSSVGQTRVIKGDSDVFWRTAHPKFNATKSDVKVRAAKVNKKPVNIGPN